MALIPAVVLLLIIRAMGDLGGWGIRQVLALSLGMTTSVLVTAGFVQGMSRRASVCLAFGDMRSAIRFLRGALLVAAIGVSAFAVSVVTVAQAVGVFAPQEVLTFLLSFLGLSTIWLLAAGLSLLRASGWLGAGLAGGLALGVVVDRSLASLPDVHLAAGALAGFLSTVAIISWALHRAVRLRSGQVQRRVALPPAAYLFWEASPYFAYGALYAVLLFIPHALGWVAVALGDQPRLWAVASLEAGLCLSLLPLILANGVAERTLQQFWRRAAATQATIPGHDPAEFNRTLTRFYWRQLVRYLVVLSVFTGLTYLVFRWTVEVGLVAAWLGLSNLDVVVNVFAAGLGAYWLLGWGLFNCMFPLTMACPNYALRALLPSTGVVIVVGLPLSLGLGFGFAAVAAIVGSAAYVLASSRMTVRMFRAADYYYASAF
ncbi:MAG TPA: hypothetical protein VF937_04145 [Chloroflexota bacterium]